MNNSRGALKTISKLNGNDEKIIDKYLKENKIDHEAFKEKMLKLLKQKRKHFNKLKM